MAAFPTIITKLPQIPSKDFTKERVLGQGGFGKVYFGKWDTVPVAVKELLVQTISDTFIKAFRSEAEMMASCQHPNTVRLYGVCLEEGKLALLMEYLDKGSLYGLLHNTDITLSWPERFNIAADTASGLSYLHNLKIVHRDLKSLNVLLAKDGTAKIADFGLAQIRLETTSKMTTGQPSGSPRWMAPEQFSQNTHASTSTDIYSLGMIMWEIASRKVPYSHVTNEYLIGTLKINNTHETIPADTPENYAALIKNCWKSPQERPTAKTLAQELTELQTKNPPSSPPTNLDTNSYLSNPLTPSYVSNTLPSIPQTSPPLNAPSPSTAPTVDTYIDHLYSLLENAEVKQNKNLYDNLRNLAKELNKTPTLTDKHLETYRLIQRLLDNNQKVRQAVAEDILEVLGEQLAPPPAIISPKKADAAALPSIAFGKAEWAKYFGDVGVEPPLPADIQTILQSPCPFWPNKKVQDTHLLVLVPQTVNGQPLTLQHLGELIQKPLQGPSTNYRGFYIGEYKDIPLAKSHWALLTRDVVEGSRNKRYSEQQALIQGKKQYEVPTILDATVAILMEHVRTGTRLYSDSPYTYTRCQEKYDKDDQLGVGGFSGSGLAVDTGYYFGNVRVGVGGLRKF